MHRGRSIKGLLTVLVIVSASSCADHDESNTTVAQDAGGSGASADDVCAAIAKRPDVAGSGSITVLRSRQTNTEGMNSWLSQRAARGGPEVSLASDTYRPLGATSTGSTVDVCVFSTTSPYQPAFPPEVKTVANGLRVFAVGADKFVIDAIGDADRLASQVDALK